MKTKSFVVMFGLATALTFLAACQNRSQDSGGAPGAPGAPGTPAGFATTPQPCNLGQPNCNSPYVLNQFPFGGVPAGFNMMFPMNANMNALNCGCNNGMAPMFNPVVQWGLACGTIPTGFNNPWAFNSGFQFNMGLNTGYANTMQYPYMAPNSGGMCGGATVYRYCDVRFQNSCEAGSSCQPFAGGSGSGLCVRAY